MMSLSIKDIIQYPTKHPTENRRIGIDYVEPRRYRRICERVGEYISCVDLSEAFWKTPLDIASKEKTAFVVPGRGLCQFKVMPFRLRNAATSQSKLIDKIFGVDLQPHVFVYLDDINISSTDFKMHLELLREVSKKKIVVRIKRLIWQSESFAANF